MRPPHSEHSFTGCTCGGDRPCRVHPEAKSTGDNLWSAEEMRQLEVERAARDLLQVVRDHRPISCAHHMQLFLHWEERLRELGIHV